MILPKKYRSKMSKPIPPAIDWWPTYKIYWQGGGPATTIRARTDGEAHTVAHKFGATGGYTVHKIVMTHPGIPDEGTNGRKEYDKWKAKEWKGYGAGREGGTKEARAKGKAV